MTVTLLVIAFFVLCLQFKKLNLFETRKSKIERMKENKENLSNMDVDTMGVVVFATTVVYLLILIWYITVGSVIGGVFIVISSLLSVASIYSFINGIKKLPEIDEYKGEQFYLSKLLRVVSFVMTIVFILVLIY